MNTKGNLSQPINFMRLWPLYVFISAVVIVPGVIFIILSGIKPAIDFTGGTILEMRANENVTITQDLIQANLPPEAKIASYDQTAAGTVIIRTTPITKDDSFTLRTNLASAAANLNEATAAALLTPLEEVQFETVGPTLGKELVQKTALAITLAGISILLYIAYRFKNVKYGVSAILAMFHDTLVLLSVFAILGYFYNIQIDTLFVTAMLTILSFSVHDTIVVYDRIREASRKHPSVPYATIINQAITETMARSINNSMTIIFMLLALLLFGGLTIRYFALALLVGTISGTYSSPFVAAPLLLLWDKLFSRKR